MWPPFLLWQLSTQGCRCEQESWAALYDLVVVVLIDKLMKGWLYDATMKVQFQEQGRIFLDEVVGLDAATFRVLGCKYQLCWLGGMPSQAWNLT